MLSPFAYSAKLAECGSKHLAMYLAIREAIAEGTLKPGEKLPSTRQLADLYGLSRGSVSLSFEMLAAEGFVSAGVGQGTFVSGGGEEAGAGDPAGTGEGRNGDGSPGISRWGIRLTEIQAETAARLAELGSGSGPSGTASAEVSFVPGGLGPERFPWQEWKAEVAQQWKSIGASGAVYDDAQGSPALRKAIAGRLRRERGIPCREEEIVVTSGSMQAIALLAQLLLEEGKTAVIETPCYTGIRNAVRATGASVLAQSTDRAGIVPTDWEAQLLIVSPTRQYPTGVVLSYERRKALLAWASKRGAWIVEDDYDSDFRWGGRPIEPLKSLDRESRVIYVGTFSRSMSASLRIGFAVVPQELLRPFLLAKRLYDPYPTGLAEQQALANWMSAGGYDRHMRKTRRTLGKLERKLRESLQTELKGLFTAVPSDAGLHVYALWEKSAEDYDRLARACIAAGVAWRHGSIYDAADPAGRSPRASALFGFAHLNEEQIEEGVRRIRRAARNLRLLDDNDDQGGNAHA